MLRFAVTPYANTLPLLHFLPSLCECEMVVRPPLQTLEQLRDARIDAAIVPAADFVCDRRFTMIPGLGVAACRWVESVLLHCRVPLGEVRTIARDADSRTTNALCRVLMGQLPGTRADVRFLPPGADADAAIVIGDRALTTPRPDITHDFAAMWWDLTGLPFVFAAWVRRADYPASERLTSLLLAARDRGLERVDELAEVCAQRLGLPVERCEHYLRNCVRYHVGAEEMRGLALFEAKLAELNAQEPAERVQ